MNRIASASLFALLLAGCATMTIEGDGSKPVDAATGTHVKHNSFYGFVWAEPPTTKCVDGNGLYRARYHTNILYSLASVLSLGLYVPQTVEWWCEAQPAEDEGEMDYVPTP